MNRLLALAAIALGCSTWGCASAPVTIPALRPAELDMAGVRRIAVCEFQGPAPYAEQARQNLSAAIAQHGQYDVPPPHLVREMLPASVPYRGQTVDIRAVVEQARHAGIDAVLVGEVVCGGTAGEKVLLGNPTIETRVETQLIDVRSGHVRGQSQAARRWRGELARSETAENSQRKITEKLIAACAGETAAKLATTNVTIEVELADAGGDDALKAGCAAAEAGNWALAAQHFEQAQQANPTSHAALYNLGLACEAQYQYAAARHWHSEALRLHEDELYRAATLRVDGSWRDYDLAMRQTQPPAGPPVMQASTSGPRW